MRARKRKQPDTSKVDARIILSIKATLKKILKSHIEQDGENWDFKVRPGYGYDKFYVNHVEGSYDMSLQSLIHHIMYEDGHYRRILNDKQFADAGRCIAEEPESIYRPATWSDDGMTDLEYQESEMLLDRLGMIYYNCIRFVGNYLSENGYDTESDFSEYAGEIFKSNDGVGGHGKSQELSAIFPDDSQGAGADPETTIEFDFPDDRVGKADRCLESLESIFGCPGRVSSPPDGTNPKGNCSLTLFYPLLDPDDTDILNVLRDLAISEEVNVSVFGHVSGPGKKYFHDGTDEWIPIGCPPGDRLPGG